MRPHASSPAVSVLIFFPYTLRSLTVNTLTFYLPLFTYYKFMNFCFSVKYVKNGNVYEMKP